MTSPATMPGFHTGRIPANKGKTHPVEVLTPDEAHRLIAACSARSASGIRNRALIATMYRGGLRVSEALELRAKDIDEKLGTMTILHGKGDKRRVIGIDPEAMALVSRWMDRRSTLDVRPGDPLFCTLAGKRMHGSYVRTLLPRLGRQAGIQKRVHPHGLRHTHAFELMIEGVPVTVIQKQLGHTSLDTTARYLNHLAPTEVIGLMQSRVWIP